MASAIAGPRNSSGKPGTGCRRHHSGPLHRGPRRTKTARTPDTIERPMDRSAGVPARPAAAFPRRAFRFYFRPAANWLVTGRLACCILTAGMRFLKLPAVALLLLALLASGQCVARCAAAPCGQASGDLPPCHRHSSPAPKVCTIPLFAAGLRAHSTPQLAVYAIAIVNDLAVPTRSQPFTPWNPPSPPRDSGGPSLATLRI
jgi:hypothetical protein